MKKQAVAPRGRAGRPAAAPARARAAVRPVRDAHERQAEGAASRFVRGESGLSRVLTPVAASSLQLPGSVPGMLPIGLRASLELAFDAELGGLRIHTDASAQDAARQIGARAFTAGASVYFGPGAWSPASDTGRELIAHEVAHALQQTGRPAQRGRLRLEPGATGDGALQRDPDPNDLVRDARDKLSVGSTSIESHFSALNLLQPGVDGSTCVAAVERHLGPDTDATVRKYAEQLKKAVDGKSLKDAVDAVDTVLNGAPTADMTDAVKALFFDAYKSLNADAAAAGVVGTDFPAQTAFGSWSFYAAHRRGDAKWVTALLKKHPVAGKYFPNAIVQVARLDFYGVTRFGLNLDPQMKFDETMADAMVEALLYQPRMPDERTAVALRALSAFDKIRLVPFQLMKKSLKGNESLLARSGVKRFFIDNYTDPAYLVRIAESKSAEPEVVQIATEAGALIAPVAKRAKRFWDTVDAMWKGIGKAQDVDPAVALQAASLREAVRTRLPLLKPLKDVEKSLIKTLQRATRLDKGALPKPADMDKHFQAAAAIVEQLSYRIDGDLARRDKTLQVKDVAPPTPTADIDPEAEEAPADVTDDMVYGAVLQLLFAVHDHLVVYTPPPATKDPAQQIRDRDEAASRFRGLAIVFWNAASILGYAELQETAATLVQARQEGLLKSHVGLLAPFEKTHATLKEFSDDFPTGEMTGGAISGQALVQMVYALYYENLLTKLNEVLAAKTPAGPPREFSYDAGQEPIVNTALKAVEAGLKLPRKYRVPQESTVLYVRPEDRTQVTDLLPLNHPVLRELLDKEMGPDENGYAPQNINAHKEGFVVWLLPDMGRLVDKLAQVPGVQQLPLPGGKLLGAPKEYALPRDWLQALNVASAENEKMRADLAGAVDTWMKGTLSDLDAPLRRATNNERHIVRPLIQAQWERLEKSFLKAPEAYYEAPRRALELTMIFAGNIQPARPDEQRLQMTALLLELAPVLARKLGETTTFGSLVTVSGTDRLDIVLPLYAHVKGAAQLATDGAVKKALSGMWLIFEMKDLPTRTGQLSALAEAFKATAEKAQEDVVLEGLPGENMLRVPNRGYPIVGRKNPDDDVQDTFMVEGVVYQLVKVHRSFSYQPELLTRGSAVPWEEEGLGKRRLWVDGQEVKADAEPVELVTIMRTPAGGKPVEIVIRSDKTAMLTELTYAVHMNVVLEQLADLAGVLEGFASVITTALQIAFPEVAAPIAYAELAGSVLRFLGSAEYAMLKGALDSDSGSLFDTGLSEIKKQLTLEALWDYLLFDEKPSLFETLSLPMQPQGRIGMFRGRGDAKTKKASGKVIGRLVRAGTELVKGAEVMHQHVAFSVRKTSLFVEGSPYVAILLRVVANNLHRLNGLDLKELGADKATDMVGEVQQMYRRFEAIIGALGSYELPDELVPLEAIVEMAVNLLIDKLPLKYRVPLKGSRNIDAVEQIFQWLFGKVADQLREARLDPNIIWREHARAALQPYLKSAGTAVSDEVQALLTKVPFLKDLGAMTIEDIAVPFVDRDPPASAQPKLAAGAAAPPGPPRLPGGPGAQLNAPAQARARRGWGHDFSHVRLHRGPAVDTGLRQAGAMAATSGSHVYLDSGLSTEGLQGGEVLNHELAHVLQQTGPRPLGTRHSSQPVRGPSGESGWRVDAAAESQADTLAKAAREPAGAPRQASRSEGLQPKLTDTIAKFFLKLGDLAKLQESAAETGKKAVDPAAMAQALPQLQANFAAKLIDALKTVGKPGSPVAFASPFDTVGQDLVDYVANNRKSDLDTSLPHVLMSGLQQIERRKGKGSAGATTETFWIVNLGRTETALEEFFFGVTGISMDVELNSKKATGPDGKDRKTIDPDQPFKRLKFNYLHLPMLGGTAKLWSDIMKNSFPKVTADKLPHHQNKARLALLGLQPGPGIFASETRKAGRVLVFGKRAKDLIETYINPPPGRDLPGDATPTWAEYIKPDPQARVKLGTVDYGQIGLRLGLYKDKGNADQQKGTDRASHHTVQYLLLEYFVNSKDKHKPFPNSLSLYPNLKGSGERVDLIATKPDGDAGIHVSSNEAGRGGEMPTILLSVHAHTLGDVHVTPKADDLDAKAASQGAAIHGIYRDALGEFADLVLGKAPPLQAIANKRQGKPFKGTDLPKLSGKEVTPEDLSGAIFTATCKTYTWMRNLMNDKLASAIDNREIEYYEALVKSAKSTAIYAANQAQPGYVPSAIGQSIKAAVLKKQVDVLHSASFGFQEAS